MRCKPVSLGVCSLLLISPLLLFLNAHAQDDNDGKRRKIRDGLTLQLKLSKSTFKPFQPIPAVAELRNNSNKKITEHRNLEFEGAGLVLEVAKENEGFRRVDLAAIQSLDMFAPSDLPRGFVLINDFEFSSFATAAETFLLRKPGKYRLRLIFSRLKGGTLTSPVVTVTIKEPTSKEQSAIDFLIEKGILGYLGVFAPQRILETDLTKVPAKLAAAQEFIDKFSDTLYADEVRIALAVFLINGIAIEVNGQRSVKKDPALAATLLRKAESSLDNENSRPRVAFLLAQALEATNNLRDAIEGFQKFLQKNPNHILSPRAKGKIRGLKKLVDALDKRDD